MPREEIYNLFVFMEGNTVRNLGVTVHELDGTTRRLRFSSHVWTRTMLPPNAAHRRPH